MSGCRLAAEAVGHEITADDEKHEDADEAQDALVAGQDDERLVRLRPLGNQKGMRKDDRQRRDEAHKVEIVGAMAGSGARHAATTADDARLSHGNEESAVSRTERGRGSSPRTGI